MHVCACMRVHVCVRASMRACVCVYACACACACEHACVCVCACVRVRVRVRLCVRACLCLCACALLQEVTSCWCDTNIQAAFTNHSASQRRHSPAAAGHGPALPPAAAPVPLRRGRPAAVPGTTGRVPRSQLLPAQPVGECQAG